MPNEKIWNPWKSEPAPSTTPADLAATRAKMDLGLTDVIGDFSEFTPPAVSANDDVYAELEERRVHGASVPREQKAALSLNEAKRALAKVSEQRYAQFRKDNFPGMLEYAETYSGPDSFEARFLRAGISGDEQELQKVIKSYGVQ